MPETEIIVDASAIEELRQDLERIRPVALDRLGERGYQLLRDEIHNTAYITGNLEQGVAPPEIEGDTATLTVSARSARRGPRSATLHLKSGKTKDIALRPVDPVNYAPIVALGRPAMRPKEAKALLIPVSSAPSNESYIEADGQFYVMRKSAKAVPANPYHERAAKRLSSESVAIVEAVVKKVTGGK